MKLVLILVTAIGSMFGLIGLVIWLPGQVKILVTAIGSMFGLIGLVIWLAYLGAKRDIEGSA